MKKKYRIKKKSEIDAIFNNRTQRGSVYFTVYVKREELNNFRFGMSIGRKFGNAVMRNKIKRQVRSIIRLKQDSIKTNNKFIVVIKPKASKLSYSEIDTEITKLLIKLKIMERRYEK